MKRLSEEFIRRIIQGSGQGNGGSGAGGGDVAGLASQAWVGQNFVSIEFFSRIFKIWGPGATSSDPDVEIDPNDVESTIKNIQAMFGFWTEQFVSALGLGSGGGGGGGGSLADLVDVIISNPQQNQTLLYDGNGHWRNGNAPSGGISLADMWAALAGVDPSKQID
jgi:hypothetical protein